MNGTTKLKTLTAAVVALALSAPALAAGPASQQLAQDLGLSPNQYSLGELMLISQVSGHERATRIMLIDKKHDRFREAVIGVMDQTGPASQ